MKLHVKKTLNKENILEKITELDLIKNYSKNFTKIGERIRSELRDDKNPSAIFYSNDNGNIFYQDFGTGEKYNTFDYIGAKYGLNYTEVLNVINNDFNLGLQTFNKKISISASTSNKLGKTSRKKPVKKIFITERGWNDSDSDFWEGRYGITIKTLNRFRVTPVSRYRVNYDRFEADKLAYAYMFKTGRIDIYQPYSEYKFFGNTRSNVEIYGLENAWNERNSNHDTIYVVSSLKEVMLLWEHYGVIAIAPQSEGSKIPLSKIENIMKFYGKMVIAYDFDTPGLLAGLKLFNEVNHIGNIEIRYTCPVIGKVLGKDLSEMKELGNEHVIGEMVLI